MRQLSASETLKNFYRQQQQDWPGLREGIEALQQVQEKELLVDGDVVRIQFNPLRAVNVTAKVANAVDGGSCFLCAAKRPAEQEEVPFGEDFLILCNPRPIFERHFTVVHKDHRPQVLAPVYDTFLALAAAYPEYAIFYNGAKSGASAPFHLHFQLVPQHALPICSLPPEATAFSGITFNDAVDFGKSDQAMLNVVAFATHAGKVRVVSFDRNVHRPKVFFENRLIVSPACVELSGVWITVRQEDFDMIAPALLSEILAEVAG